ncbi:sortase domain-bontaining protein [Streptomyces sp. NPDC101733]|uniref:sortase domain-containing protein n=1 Tax=unclassified Streptomyces TaxID=2593676 RepID=UPI0037F75AF4
MTPGEPGPAVLVAHFDTKHGPALMKDVKKIRLGDLVEVPRADGATAKFKIREIEEVNKKAFPTDKVYGPTPPPRTPPADLRRRNQSRPPHQQRHPLRGPNPLTHPRPLPPAGPASLPRAPV